MNAPELLPNPVRGVLFHCAIDNLKAGERLREIVGEKCNMSQAEHFRRAVLQTILDAKQPLSLADLKRRMGLRSKVYLMGILDHLTMQGRLITHTVGKRCRYDLP